MARVERTRGDEGLTRGRRLFESQSYVTATLVGCELACSAGLYRKSSKLPGHDQNWDLKAV